MIWYFSRWRARRRLERELSELNARWLAAYAIGNYYEAYLINKTITSLTDQYQEQGGSV